MIEQQDHTREMHRWVIENLQSMDAGDHPRLDRLIELTNKIEAGQAKPYTVVGYLEESGHPFADHVVALDCTDAIREALRARLDIEGAGEDDEDLIEFTKQDMMIVGVFPGIHISEDYGSAECSVKTYLDGDDE